MTYEECKQLLESINIGSKIHYRSNINSNSIHEGYIRSIKECRHGNDDECFQWCPGFEFGIDDFECACICYHMHKNKTIITEVFNMEFIDENEMLL